MKDFVSLLVQSSNILTTARLQQSWRSLDSSIQNMDDMTYQMNQNAHRTSMLSAGRKTAQAAKREAWCSEYNQLHS
jgi:hypothetical protein